MPTRIQRTCSAGLRLLGALSLLASPAGCDKPNWDWFKTDAKAAGTSGATTQTVIPAYTAGTVAQYARMEAGGDCRVQGYGLVVGLGRNGSSQVPPHLMEYFKKYLAIKGIGSPRLGTGALSAAQLLRDVDTAVVLLDGTIPPGAPDGTRFDIAMVAFPNTDTRSLEGGALLEAEMRLAFGGIAMPEGPTQPLATAGGEVFVNPFIDPNKPAEQARLREGRVIGGGKVTKSRSVMLMMYQPDYAAARRIQQRLNERFPGPDAVASAKNSSVIEIRIPRHYRSDYDHFLQLVMHLPLGSGQSATDAHIRQIAAAMDQAAANHDELALVWEAIGKQALPTVQNLYTARNPAVAFYAARTGLRMGDESVAGDVLIRFATTKGSTHQIAAIEELGRSSLLRASPPLRQLLDDENEMIRIAAYEALLARGDRTAITRIDVGGTDPDGKDKGFSLDLVASHRDYVVYATQTREPRIVLFGKDMEVVKPVFFNPPDDAVMISARREDANVTVFRKIPRTGKYSDAFQIGPVVRELIVTLGSPASKGMEGGIMGLNFTHGQIVSFLYQMCKGKEGQRDINARFVLQPLPGIQRILREFGTVGRPDTPSE